MPYSLRLYVLCCLSSFSFPHLSTSARIRSKATLAESAALASSLQAASNVTGNASASVAPIIHIKSAAGYTLSNNACLCNTPCVGGKCGIIGECPAIHAKGIFDSYVDDCGDSMQVREHIDVSVNCMCSRGGESGKASHYHGRVLGKLSDASVTANLSNKRGKDLCAEVCCSRALRSRSKDMHENPYKSVSSFQFNYRHTIHRKHPMTGETERYTFAAADLAKLGIVRGRDLPRSSAEDDPRAALEVSVSEYKGRELHRYYSIKQCHDGGAPKLKYQPVAGFASEVGEAMLAGARDSIHGAIGAIPGVRPSGNRGRGGGGGGLDGIGIRLAGMAAGW